MLRQRQSSRHLKFREFDILSDVSGRLHRQRVDLFQTFTRCIASEINRKDDSLASSDTSAGNRVLLAALLLCFVLGSVHAFSVFIEPMEQAFSASRSSVSLTYSFALVALTFAVLTGHRTFTLLRPARFVALVCLLGAIGALVASWASSLAMIWFGYSLMFGLANGLGYGFSLQLAAQANPGREGRVMGIVTACYALGATIAPPLFSWGMAYGGFGTAMQGLSCALLIVAPICAVLLATARVEFAALRQSKETQAATPRLIVMLWFSYGAAVSAGLMAIGHATGIAAGAGLTQQLWIAPMVVAICNMCGSLVGGVCVDRLSPGKLLAILPGMSALALLLLSTTNTTVVALIWMGCVGFTYGAIIAVYPAVISKMVGAASSTRVYGRVFTAWGMAGLFAPWFAGFLFDQSADYTFALIIAAALGAGSAICVSTLFRSIDR